jgi:hypothetical protein
MSLLWGSSSGQGFDRTYATPNVDDGAQVLINSPDGNFLVGGYRRDSAFVMMMDPFGGPIWSKTFQPVASYANCVYHLDLTPDGYLIGCGNALGGSPLGPIASFFFKFDLAGNLLWTSRSSIGSQLWTSRILAAQATEYMGLSQVRQTSGTFNDIITSRLNAASGSLTWQSPKLDLLPSLPYIDDLYSGVVTPGQVYGAGRMYVDGSAPGSMRPFLSSFDSNGNHLWTKYFLGGPGSQIRSYGIDILNDADSLTICCFGDPNGSSSNYSIQVIRMDTSGNVAWAKDFDLTASASEVSIGICATPAGYAIGGYTINGPVNDAFVLMLDHAGTVLWARAYGVNNGANDNTRVTCTKLITSDGSDILMAVRTGNTGGYDIRVIRADSTGQGNCIQSTPIAVTTTTLSNTSYLVTPDPANWPLTITQGPLASDSPLMDDGCPNVQLDLGNDTTVCDTLLLSANVPGASYLWNDGSTSDQLYAQSAGTYSVAVTLGCCTYSDTIQIAQAPPPVASFSYWPDGGPMTYSFASTGTPGTTNSWIIGSSVLQGDSIAFTFNEIGHYIVCLVVTNACGSDTTCQQVDVFPTSLVPMADQSSPVLSQPIVQNGMLVISIDPNVTIQGGISIFDSMGRCVQRADRAPGTSRIELPLSASPAGSYFIQARTTDGRTHTARFVVAR